MERDQSVSIWGKVDPALAGSARKEDSESSSRTPSGRFVPPGGWRRFWRWRRPLLDGVGTVLWVYAVLKVFIVDLDQAIFGELSDYRFFGFLAALVALVLVLRRPLWIGVGLAYVAGFPIVVLLWKVPKWLYKTGSPGAFLAAGNVITSLLGNFRRSLLLTAVGIFTGLVIAVSPGKIPLAIAGTVMLALVIEAFVRTIQTSAAPSRFLRFQQEAIRRIVESPSTDGIAPPDEFWIPRS